jgi:hypothetical protein
MATGGYSVIDKHGDVTSFSIFDRGDFKACLYDGALFETPSPEKHAFGNIYAENGGLRIKLNLQIRFVKNG